MTAVLAHFCPVLAWHRRRLIEAHIAPRVDYELVNQRPADVERIAAADDSSAAALGADENIDFRYRPRKAHVSPPRKRMATEVGSRDPVG